MKRNVIDTELWSEIKIVIFFYMIPSTSFFFPFLGSSIKVQNFMIQGCPSLILLLVTNQIAYNWANLTISWMIPVVFYAN